VTTPEAFFAPSQHATREPARPKAVNPQTGQEQAWTRASTYAASLKDPFALIRSNLRKVVQGIGKREDLARMLLANAVEDDTAKTDEIIAAALAAMESDAKANEGTAAHAALVRSWVHQDEMPPPEFLPLVQAFAKALKDNQLIPVAAEQKILNLLFGSMGHFDWVFQEADSSCVIGDVKTGKIEYAMREFAVQCGLYDGADYLVHKSGETEPIPWKMAHTHAVLIHIDLEHNNAVSIYRVDLRLGRYGAGLAEQVRQWHKINPLTPYVPPAQRFTGPATVSAEAIGPKEPSALANTSVVVDRGVTVNEHGSGGVTVNEHEDDVRNMTEAEFSQHVDDEARRDAQPELDHVAIAAEAGPSPLARFDELMANFDKAGLQQLLKHQQFNDLSHNRRWLARALVAIEQGMDERAVKKYAAAKDDGAVMPNPGPSEAELFEAGAGEAGLGPSIGTILEAVSGANSEGAIEALRRDIVERRGDQAWTDEMAAAARQRAISLLSDTQVVDLNARTLTRIRAAETQEELKKIWEAVTIGASVPERWTHVMTTAGNERLDQLRAATPPPPPNPFG
jgi:hypothetical protein